MQILPQYQLGHERAIFKSLAVVADTKKLLQRLNPIELVELRALQRAPNDHIHQVFAAIVVACTFIFFHINRICLPA